MPDSHGANKAILADLPERLKLARLGCGLSQVDLAKASGVGEKSISSFENGSRTFSIKFTQLADIATACGMTVCDLLMDPLESFGVDPGEITRMVAKRNHEPMRLVRKIRQPSKPKQPLGVKRGITIFRSSDFFQSSLGEAQRL